MFDRWELVDILDLALELWDVGLSVYWELDVRSRSAMSSATIL